MKNWHPLGAKTTVTCSLPHPENECQQNINNCGACIIANEGIARIFERITELSTTLIGENTIYQRNNTDSKIIDIANCKTCNNNILAVEYAILITYYCQTATTKALYESKDGPAGRPVDNLPSPDGFRDFHRSVQELTVWEYSQSCQPIWQRFGLDPDPDPK